MALMIFVDNLIKSLENREYVLGVFLDFSKAFDTINHSILLTKLHHYFIRGPVFTWFQSYLSDRQQFVTYNGVQSSMKVVKCGVPQGSILGPILLLLYINDLSTICRNTLPFLFADDTNLFISGTNFTHIEEMLNLELQAISLWLKVNKLSLNVKRLIICYLSTKDRTNQVYVWTLMDIPSMKCNIQGFLESILIISWTGRSILDIYLVKCPVV